jgi:hypothetical protein
MTPDLPIDADTLDGLAAASDEEAAAIVAAISAHRHAMAAAAAAAATDDPSASSQRSWRFAGRLSGLKGTTSRPPSSTPTDDWTAAGRADRF